MKTSLLLVFALYSQWIGAQSFEVKTIDIDSEIQGDLYLGDPQSRSVVLLIAGSGPTDRNGNQLPSIVNNSLKLLATGLAEKSCNVFTFDKRIIAQLRNNSIREGGIFENPVNDVVLIMDVLGAQFTDIIILGHSEGSLMGILAAQQKTALAFVSIAGPAQSIDKIISKQITTQAPFLKAKITENFEQLKKGEQLTDVIPMLQSIFNPVNLNYLQSWMKYEPTLEIAKLKIPILIINGSKDLQVEESEASSLHQAASKSELVLITGMNHVFKHIENETDNIKSYKTPNMPLHPDLIPTITSFLALIK